MEIKEKEIKKLNDGFFNVKYEEIPTPVVPKSFEVKFKIEDVEQKIKSLDEAIISGEASKVRKMEEEQAKIDHLKAQKAYWSGMLTRAKDMAKV